MEDPLATFSAAMSGLLRCGSSGLRRFQRYLPPVIPFRVLAVPCAAHRKLSTELCRPCAVCCLPRTGSCRVPRVGLCRVPDWCADIAACRVLAVPFAAHRKLFTELCRPCAVCCLPRTGSAVCRTGVPTVPRAEYSLSATSRSRSSRASSNVSSRLWDFSTPPGESDWDVTDAHWRTSSVHHWDT